MVSAYCNHTDVTPHTPSKLAVHQIETCFQENSNKSYLPDSFLGIKSKWEDGFQKVLSTTPHEIHFKCVCLCLISCTGPFILITSIISLQCERIWDTWFVTRRDSIFRTGINITFIECSTILCLYCNCLVNQTRNITPAFVNRYGGERFLQATRREISPGHR